MSQEERLEFEIQLQNDTDMSEKFEIYKETNQFLVAKFDSNAIDFKKNLETISRVNFSEVQTKSKVIAFKPWYYAVAATVAVTFGIWFMDSGNPEYGDFNQHENASFVERGITDENVKEAQNAFNAKDYNKAATSFNKMAALSPEEQYFYAISLIETGKFTQAEKLLIHLQQGTTVYKDKATWYLALSNLKQKKFDECETYLNQIPADAEDFDKAQKLLKDLD
jgi:tetratricopeptide (TPR) repeat protein